MSHHTAYAISEDSGRLLLGDGRLALREFTPEDAAAVADGKPGGAPWIDGEPGEGTVEAAGMAVRAAIAGLHRSPWSVFAILRADDGVALGSIGFHGPPADGVVEVGYELSPSARGAGWATASLRMLVDWTLDRPEIRTVTAATEADNAPSQAVLARSGFRRVADRGCLRAYERTAAGGPGTSPASGPPPCVP